MDNKQMHNRFLAIELILEDGMGTSAVANMVGKTTETVEKWLADYQQEQEENLCTQEADLIAMQSILLSYKQRVRFIE